MAGLLRQLETDMGLAGKLVQAEVKTLTPVGATGQLRGGIKPFTFRQGDTIITEVTPDKEYAPYVEFGTKAPRKAPPFEPLLYWVTRRLGLAGKEAISATRAIQRKIAVRGTKAQKMFTKVANDSAIAAKIKHLIELGISSYIAKS